MAKSMFLELQAIANGIGKFYDGVYVKESDAIDCVKDLIKSLRRDNELCEIRRFLGTSQILQNDLIPLISCYGANDEEIFDVTIRCLMNLTQPARIVFRNEIPQDKITRQCYIDTENHLKSYKQAFVKGTLFNVLTEKLTSLLELNWEERSEEQNVLIERIIILVRNVLHVPPTDDDKLRTDDDATTHDQIIWQIHEAGLDKLILYMASSDNERRFCIHLLEIISLMFREQTPEQLAYAGAARHIREVERDEQELAKLAEMERSQKRAQLLKLSARHSRFGGTFVMKGIKSISDQDILFHRPLTEVKEHSFDNGKKAKKKPKNRQPIHGDECVRRSTLSIRMCLKDLCIEFIRNCYNPLMRAVKSALENESKQENDETYYLWSMRFFMQFQRLYNFNVEFVRETLSVQEFHYVYTMMLNHQDMMMMDKKEAVNWGKRLHLALRTYRELLETVQAMAASSSSQVRESAKVIQQNIFYLMEYKDSLLLLLKKFDNTRQSKLYAKDLIETTHLYVRAMENWCKSQGKVMVLKKKNKAVRRKKKEKTPAAGHEEQNLLQNQLEDDWSDIGGELSEILQGLVEITESVTPFDATSSTPIDEQRLECIKSIHSALKQGKCCSAVALLRAAREVWPEDEAFGAADIPAEDEFMLLREIYFANITAEDKVEVNATEQELEEGDAIEDEEMEGVGHEVVEKEQEFDLKEFLLSFSSPKIIQVYGMLLTLYKTNDVHTNHCITKMLHRIAVQNEMVAMLFQISLFRTFQKIFNDDATKAPQFNEIKTFATFVLRQFFKCLEKNPKVYVEIMFWKNMKETHEITEGYGTYKAANSNAKVIWTEEQEYELRKLYDEYKNTDGDVVDKILANLIDQSRTRRQVVRQLILLDLVTDSKQLKKSKPAALKNQWREEELEQLRNLYETYRNDSDPAGEVMIRMNKTRRQITSKLVEIGLVTDRKLLKKPRRGRKNHENFDDEEPIVHLGNHEENGSESLSDDDGDDDDDNDDNNSNIDENSRAKGSAFSDLVRGDPDVLLAQIKTLPNMDYCLAWIQRSLIRSADDREEDGEDAVATPLIPLMEECEAALQDKAFQRFLYSIGIKPPTNEQEQFWRISLELTPDLLRRVAKCLDPSSNEEFPPLHLSYAPAPSNTRNTTRNSNQSKNSSDTEPEGSIDKAKRKKKQPLSKPKKRSTYQSSESENEKPKQKDTSIKGLPKKKRKFSKSAFSMVADNKNEEKENEPKIQESDGCLSDDDNIINAGEKTTEINPANEKMEANESGEESDGSTVQTKIPTKKRKVITDSD